MLIHLKGHFGLGQCRGGCAPCWALGAALPLGQPLETRWVPSQKSISDFRSENKKGKKKTPTRINPISGNNHVGPTILIFYVVHIWESNSGK